MDTFTFDCRQLADLPSLPMPVPLAAKPPRKPLSTEEQSAVRTAIRAGKAVGPGLAVVEEVIDVGSRPVKAAFLTPASMRTVSRETVIKFSTATDLTVALGTAASGAFLGTIIGSVGVDASTTREVGIFSTVGVGVTSNSPSASVGGELALVFGTPADLAGPYFGIAVGAGSGMAVTGTLLFSPTLPLIFPLEFTLMGVSLNLSATLPTKLPVSVTLEVTETKAMTLAVV